MKIYPLFVILLLAFVPQVYAGWYNCYNFEGKIGDYAVSLTFQYQPYYFGESEKQNLNVLGCYKYDRINTPIRLEGIFVKKTRKIILNEVGDDGNYTAYMELEETAPNVWKGGWQSLNSPKNFGIEIHLTTQLSDENPDFSFSEIEILQAESLPDYYLVGVYGKEKNSHRASMTALKIIRKNNNELFQTLDFSDYFYDVGNLKTIIYDNIELYRVGYTDDRFRLWSDVGRVGGYYEIKFDREKKRFIVSEEPLAEGADDAVEVPQSGN